MKILFVMVLCLATLESTEAQDSLASGGKSPNGKYEIRIYEDDSRDPSNYVYGLFNEASGKLVSKLNVGGGFCNYGEALGTSKVEWNASSTLVAILDLGARHSNQLYAYHIKSSHVIILSVPDYLAKALSLVGAQECYYTSFVGPMKWQGNSLVCHFLFDAHTDEGRSPFYENDFTLDFEAKTGKLLLRGMTKPSVDAN